MLRQSTFSSFSSFVIARLCCEEMAQRPIFQLTFITAYVGAVSGYREGRLVCSNITYLKSND